MDTKRAEGRVARRQKRNRTALLEAGEEVMSEKGIDAATMQEIAERADVGAGTVYNYFKSKDDLAVAVLENIMERLAERIEDVTDTFSDPAQVYAFGIRQVLETATGDVRWKQLLHRSEVIADALYRRMGPYPMRDMRLATEAGRFNVTDPALIWRLTSHAIVGFALGITKDGLPPSSINEAVIRLLCMTGLAIDDAAELAARPCPPLPPQPAPRKNRISDYM
ncbi:TetR/AcrR family transcriptional regulator [Rhizobium sp. KVB221]|uniref:TetR/AcrR family transcriptional regulator n=1 Tax=Rhizobium setariae TaxID=2801340 RepID=A0A936YKB8_9HYPH|nr:TetR/AcrR family transcriptional regulator [Rhizobium setariae]MBL0371890.1 TetR/AcrR family transcriptional regulator [Rhizobium setariae]